MAEVSVHLLESPSVHLVGGVEHLSVLITEVGALQVQEFTLHQMLQELHNVGWLSQNSVLVHVEDKLVVVGLGAEPMALCSQPLRQGGMDEHEAAVRSGYDEVLHLIVLGPKGIKINAKD